jgi:lipopolysaccharide/colanic/teichoic acid biosynthesis glycosyltransferase
MSKRALDVLLSACGLLLLSPLMAVVAALVVFDSGGPILFRQERVGRRFRSFTIFKFRTMRVGAAAAGPAISVGEDPRVTRIGRTLRRTKIDELPQLLNVLKGDMSLVGPRPELREFVERFPEDYAVILEARPGLTDLASIKYRDEAALLASAVDPEAEYVGTILPDKIRLSREYVLRSSLSFDLALLFKTVFLVARRKAIV